jgi:hypothetical protein
MRTSQTACSSGHAFTAANTILRANGTRACRACHRERVRKNEARREPRCWRCRRTHTACACELGKKAVRRKAPRPVPAAPLVIFVKRHT